jgi:hypothetical protein
MGTADILSAVQYQFDVRPVGCCGAVWWLRQPQRLTWAFWLFASGLSATRQSCRIWQVLDSRLAGQVS